jgi:head-tail adaptor
MDDTTWTTVSRPWGNAKALNGAERTHAQAIHAEASYEVMMRYDGQIFPNRRLLIPQRADVLDSALSTTTGTSLEVSEAIPRPDDRNYTIKIDSETLIVTAGHHTTGLTVTRGAYGSTAATHSSGAAVVQHGELYIKAVLPVANKRAQVRVLCGETA